MQAARGAALPGSPAFHRPISFQELFTTLHAAEPNNVRIVAGNTGAGVYKNWPVQASLVELKHIPRMRQHSITKVCLMNPPAVLFSQA